MKGLETPKKRVIKIEHSLEENSWCGKDMEGKLFAKDETDECFKISGTLLQNEDYQKRVS